MNPKEKNSRAQDTERYLLVDYLLSSAKAQK